MEPYKNVNGDSGIKAYEIGNDYITVEFHNGAYKFYKYTYSSAGTDNVEHMKGLAVQGYGLNAYINSPEIRKAYESRW